MVIETKYDFGDVVKYKVKVKMDYKQICPVCNGRSPEELRLDCKNCDNYGWIREERDEEIETVGTIRKMLFDDFQLAPDDKDAKPLEERSVVYWIKAIKDLYTEFGAVQIPHRIREENILGKSEE